MAHYHLETKIGSRGSGQSAVASAAYRSGTLMCDERTGEVYDYSRREGVVESMILAPGGAPDWVKDRPKLWNEVERVEKRKDAQVYREIELALPVELTDAQRAQLVRDWVAQNVTSQGMVADVCIHRSRDRKTKRWTQNYHAHIQCTTRCLTPDGFGKKERSWNDRSMVTGWRKSWAMATNQTYERLGIAAMVDHRSHRARGIDREPQIHHGGRSGLMAKNDAVIARNAERDALDREEAAILATAQSRQKTDETMKDIAGLMVRAAKRQRDAKAAEERQRQAEEAAALELLAARGDQARQDAEALADQADAYLAERDRQVEQERRRAEEAARRQKAEESAREEARRRAQAPKPKPQIPVIADGQTLEGRIEESTRAGWWVIGGHQVPAGGQHQVGDMVRVKRVGDRLDVVDLNLGRIKAPTEKAPQGPDRGRGGHGRGM